MDQRFKISNTHCCIKKVGKNRICRLPKSKNENFEDVKPQEVLSDWSGKFSFKKDDPELNQNGLRPPQLGALYAIASYFAVDGEYEPATIVLPTGTGKTETMLSALVYHGSQKLLVLVPNDQLRYQIFRKFLSLGILPDLGIVPKDIQRPIVALIDHKIDSIAEAQEIIENSNVIIATPSVLNLSDEEVLNSLCGGCTDLFIDEAHHSPANTWNKVKQKFLNKRIVQFTATPFRKDGKQVGGKIIFNYKLGYAQRDSYYQPIRFSPVVEYGDQNACDEKIARKAVEILRDDVNNLGADHILMARVSSKKRANQLLPLYEKLAPEYHPVVIYSGAGTKIQNRENLEKLGIGSDGENRLSRIVICVDMLGEGFDLSNLKIAAIHDSHKSLAVTLQFIGRFTRQNQSSKIQEAAVVINTADPQAEKSIQDLYSEGADWDKIIKRLSEERITKEENLQAVIEDLKQNGTLGDQISLWNLRPSFVAQIYKTNCQSWNPEKYLEAFNPNSKCWHSIGTNEKILVVLTVKEDAVKWGVHQGIEDLSNQLIIVYWDSANSAMFVYSNDYNSLPISRLVEVITNNSAELINDARIFNILNNVQLPLAKNLGSSRIGAISFTQYFGTNVTEGLHEIEKCQSELSNIACIGYEDGDRVIWGGAKKKGKIWAVKSGSILDWTEWCNKVWAKVSSQEVDEGNVIHSFLRPVKIQKHHQCPAIAVQWGEYVQARGENNSFIAFGEKEAPIYFVDIEVANIGSTGAIEIRFFSDDVESIYELEIDDSKYSNSGGYNYKLKSGEKITFCYSGKKFTLEEYMKKDPVIIIYSDGSYSYNCYLIAPKYDVGTLSADMIESWDWDGIDLRKESITKENRKDSIQYKVYEKIKDEFDFIFNDDASGEAADIIALKATSDNQMKLCFIHCKGAKDGKPSGQIDNMYIVCGQAQKSIRWKHAGMHKLCNHINRREESWQNTGNSRILKGDMRMLNFFKNLSRKSKTVFEVLVIQPGLSKSAATEDILRLLGTTDLYLSKTTQASFRVIGSK